MFLRSDSPSSRRQSSSVESSIHWNSTTLRLRKSRICHAPASSRCPKSRTTRTLEPPFRISSAIRSLLAPSELSRSGGPPSPERHAVIDQPPAELDLHLFEAAQPGVDVPFRPLERSRQRHRVSGRLGGGAGRVRPDDERRIAKKAHAAE